MFRLAGSNGFQPVGRTFVPSLSSNSVLTVVEISPERFEVKYPTRATGLMHLLSVFGMFAGFFPLAILAILLSILVPRLPFVLLFFLLCAAIPMFASRLFARLFRRPDGGLLRLEKARLTIHRGAVLRSSSDVATSTVNRFEILDNGGDESMFWVLQMATDLRPIVVANQSDLTLDDLKWLKRQLNAWLGWEFPTHCVACGNELGIGDIDWSRRAVACTGCRFEGPAPDPPATDNTLTPPATCPSCTQKIALKDVNRETGGCRCRGCGWVSEATPPVRFVDHEQLGQFVTTAVDWGIGKLFQYRWFFLPEELLQYEFRTVQSAIDALRSEVSVEESSDDTLEIGFSRWRTESLMPVLSGLIVVSLIFLALLTWYAMNPKTNWTRYVDYGFFLFCVATFGSASIGLIWWSNQAVSMTATSYGLLLRMGRRERLMAWHTVNAIAVQRDEKLPLLMLKYGGAGVAIVTPNKKIARALARIFADYRDRAKLEDEEEEVVGDAGND